MSYHSESEPEKARLSFMLSQGISMSVHFHEMGEEKEGSMRTTRRVKSLGIWVAAFMLTFALGVLPAQAADEGARLAEQFLKKIPLTSYDQNMTMEQAMKIQAQFVEALKPTFGEVVGYKAGLTNVKVQQALGVTHPLRGTLLKKMLLKSGAVVEANYGSRPFSEGDLIVRVGSAEINKAKTQQECLKFLDAVIPFIEMPDMPYAKEVKLNGPAIAAVNVAARLGVLGAPIPLKASEEWINRLKNFKLQVFDDKGTVLGEGQGSSLLGDPLSVVLWIKDSLKAEGKKLKKGDLLSLGSITKGIPTAPNTTLRAHYTDLDPKGPVDVTVKFK
jgi:2-keto-4-pentenoate hydratase